MATAVGCRASHAPWMGWTERAMGADDGSPHPRATKPVITTQLAIHHGEESFVLLGQQTMLQCSPNPEHCRGLGKCGGATGEVVLNYIADVTTNGSGGMYTLEDVPYTGGEQTACADLTEGKSPYVGVAGWTKLPTNDYKSVMNALAKVGPLAIAVAANDWGGYEGGIFATNAATVNHAVLLVGYGENEAGEKFWKVRNSWGPGFGIDGYIHLKRTDDDDNNCHMDNDPLLGVACALDQHGNKIDVEPVETCGTSAIMFDVAYPNNVKKIG